MKYLAFTIYWTQQENMIKQNIFFWKSLKKSRKVYSRFFLLSFCFGFMRSQTFEISKKYVFYQITFFKESKRDHHLFWRFLKLWFCTFWYINRNMLEKKIFFEILNEFFFHKKTFFFFSYTFCFSRTLHEKITKKSNRLASLITAKKKI